jgi:hypothetical protein
MNNERNKMNERIRELAVEAGMILGDAGEFDMAKFMPKEVKFAELIVKECMSLVSEPGPDMNDTERGILAQIKHHFGVEA